MYGIIFDFVTGLVFGLEHIDLSDMEDEDGRVSAIVLHLGIVRISLVKFLPEV